MKICYLYPGQGAQYPGMGKDFFDRSASVRELFELASEACGIDTPRLLFESSEAELKETRNTQISITLMNLAVRAYLQERGIESSGAAGFSLGEWSAYVDAGVLPAENVFPIVMKRAELMARAAERLAACSEGSADAAADRVDTGQAGSGTGSGMAAVIGLAAEAVEKVIGTIDGVYPANYNSPDQTVISGSAEAVGQASEACKQAGARRVIPLKVSGPFHTPLLREAEEAFAEYLADISFRKPVKPLYSNVTGASVSKPEDVRTNAVRQIVSPVRWTSEEGHISSGGFDLCVECGPGKVLGGLWKKSGSELPCISTNSLDAAEALLYRISEMDK